MSAVTLRFTTSQMVAAHSDRNRSLSASDASSYYRVGGSSSGVSACRAQPPLITQQQQSVNTAPQALYAPFRKTMFADPTCVPQLQVSAVQSVSIPIHCIYEYAADVRWIA
jgi:hypothetical protein